MQDEQYLTVKDVMSRYKVGRMTVFNWLRDGLASVKIGRTVRIAEADLAEFIAKHKRQAVTTNAEPKPQGAHQ